ncbi:MAG TPA: hypothetical protein DCQ33_13060 [Nitrospira sp.]|nr:hypothetical protein [Nitrospira sp.]
MFHSRTAQAATTDRKNGRTATENGRTRVIGYGRVSTEQQAQEGVSLEAQRAKLTAYCDALDLELIEVISDAGASGSSLKRPGIQRVLRLLETGKGDAVLVTKLDRLTRSVKDLGFLVENYFMGGKYSLLSVGDSIDTRTAAGRMIMNILASLGQGEREAIAERTREALAEIKSQGYRFGSPPYGYRRGGLDEHGRAGFIPDEEQQKGLRRILELHDAGTGIEEIIRTVNSEGLRSSRGKRWHRPALYRLLRREGRIARHLQIQRPKRWRELAAHDRNRTLAVAQALRAQGLSLRQIGAALSAQGLTPPGGRRWHASTLATLLGYMRG